MAIQPRPTPQAAAPINGIAPIATADLLAAGRQIVAYRRPRRSQLPLEGV